MSNERETQDTKEFKGDIGGVNNRLADSAVNGQYFQLAEGIMPWEGEHRRVFGKKTTDKVHGTESDRLAVLTLHALPGNHLLIQTREGLIMDHQYDLDAVRWWKAAGGPGIATLQRVSKLATDLKAANIWKKLHCLYPFAGGTALAHAQNLISANFTITWNFLVGNVTHDANGITGPGYGDTGWSPNAQLTTIASAHLGAYVRSGAGGAHGSWDAGGSRFGIHAPWVDLNLYVDMNDPGNRAIGPGATQLLVGNRTSLSDLFAYKQGVQVGYNAFSVVNARPLPTVYILTANNAGVPWIQSNDNIALFSLGLGLSPAEMADYAVIVQNFQTAMGRQV